MSDWDGTRWVADEMGTESPRSTRANRAATVVMLLGLAALVIPFAGTLAASRKSDPTLSVGCGSGCLAPTSLGVGSTLAVHGTGFTPSAGGQQVILWIGYPNDYCSGSICHGFYDQPRVDADGTFSASYESATLDQGIGTIKAIQYNARTDKWVNVASVSYTVH